MKQLLTIFFFLIGTFTYAQNISVTDFRLDEMDLTANQQGTTVLDQNGEKCALIKVKTTQTGFSFDAGSLGVSKTLQKTAEIWVYVPHGVRKLNVSHQKFGSLEYALPVTTQKAKTYIMELNAEKPIPVDHQKLSIKCKPANAIVMIDGSMVEKTGELTELTLKIGSHEFIAMAEGYYQQNGTVTLSPERPGRLTIDLELKEPQEQLQKDNAASNSSSSKQTQVSTSSNNVGFVDEMINALSSNVNVQLGQTLMSDIQTMHPGKERKRGAEFVWNSKTGTSFHADSNISPVKRVVFNAYTGKTALPEFFNGISLGTTLTDWKSWFNTKGIVNVEVKKGVPDFMVSETPNSTAMFTAAVILLNQVIFESDGKRIYFLFDTSKKGRLMSIVIEKM